MARTALGDRTNFINAPGGKLAPLVAKKEQLPVQLTPQRQQYTASYSPSPASYQHDPYATTPSPLPMQMTHSPMSAVQVPDLQPYPAEGGFYDYQQQQEQLPPPPQLLQASHGPPSAPASPTQHYAPTWQVQTDVAQHAPAPSGTYFPPAEPPVEVRGVATVKFRIRPEEEFSTAFGVKVGDFVLVDGDRGYDLGEVTGFTSTEEVREKKAVRMASDNEVTAYLKDIPAKERQVVREATEIIKCSGLDMTITDAEFQFDMAKLTLYYTSPMARTDWRSVLGDLFRKFQCRIWFSKSVQKS